MLNFKRKDVQYRILIHHLLGAYCQLSVVTVKREEEWAASEMILRDITESVL